MFVDVVTYSFPALGLTPPLSDPVRARRLVLTNCFSQFTGDANVVEGNYRVEVQVSPLYIVSFYTHIVSFVTSLLSPCHPSISNNFS